VNRFDGEAKIVGDVLTRHRKLDCRARGHAVRHFQENAKNAATIALPRCRPLQVFASPGRQRSGVIVALPILSGLHHHYVRI